MPASIAATCCGVSGARQSMPATSPTNSGCSGRMDRLMPLSLSEHSSAAEPIAAAAARQCRRRRRKTRRAGVYKAGETAAGGAGKGGAAVGEAAFLPRPAAGAALRRLLAWLTAARILRRNTLELFPPEAFAEEVVHRRSLGRDQIILSQPAAIHRILVENPHNYGRTAATVRILRPLLGEGLLLSEGEEWARQRRAHAPAFAPRMVPLLARRVAEAAEATIAELAAADGAPVDLLAALQKLALDVAGRVLFSLDMRPFAAPLRALVERYGDGLGRPRLLDFLLPPAVPSPHDLLRRRLRRRWLALVARIIAARRALPEPDPPDLFALLAAANAAAGGGEQRLVDQVATMLLAGHETTAAALFWAVLLLCDDPAAAARLRDRARRQRGRPRRRHRGAGRHGRADRAVGAAPPPPAVARARTLRPDPLPARGAAARALPVHAVRHRPAGVHRRAIRADRGDAGAGPAGRRLRHRARRPRTGHAGRDRDDPARPSPAVPAAPAPAGGRGGRAMTRRRLAGAALAAGLLLLAPAAAGPAAAAGATVATYHGDIARSGRFVVPGLSWARAPLLHLDPAFAPRFSGHLYAQPLFWRPPGAGAGMLVVATESDTVAAIDAASGRILWQRVLGVPVPLAALPCGNIDPLGITGTPVIDGARAAVYVDAVDGSGGRVRHLVWGLALGDGATLPGWPVDVAAALAARGERFIARDQHQRGALALFDGRVYVPYGGISAIAATIAAGSSASPRTIRATSRAGTRRRAAAASGRRAASPATGARCSSRPATRSGRSAGAAARPSSACRPICMAARGGGISSRRPTGARSMRATSISAAPTRCRSTCPPPAAADRRWCWRSARTGGPICSTAAISAASAARLRSRPSPAGRSSPPRPPIPPGTASSSHSAVTAAIARPPAPAARSAC